MQRPHYHLGRAFHPRETRPRRLEKVRREHQTQHRPDVIPGTKILRLQPRDGLRIRRRRILPGRHRNVVRYKKVVQMPAHKPRRRPLPADDGDNVVPVEIARLPQKRLHPVIVVRGVIPEPPGRLPVGNARHIVIVNRPPRKGPRRLLNIILRIIRLPVHAHAHGEQLQQLAPPVLVDRPLVIEIIVQPENHRRIPRHLHQQRLKTAQPVLPEQINLVEHRLFVQHLRQPRGEHTMPEQRDLFRQRTAARVDIHPVHRLRERPFNVPALFPVNVVPLNDVLVRRRLPLRVQQPLHSGIVPTPDRRVQLRRRGPEPRPPQQMRQKRPLLPGRIRKPVGDR